MQRSNLQGFVLKIQEEWLNSVKSIAGETSRESASIFSTQIPIEDGQFVLELLQNAEDARMELGKGGGFFSLRLDRDKAEVRHNGKPFDANDIKRLCSTGSSKKPERGYKGWIGVGFKSVFKVSENVYIHSRTDDGGDVCFEFNKNYWHRDKVAEELEKKYSLKPSDIPWQLVPIPVECTEALQPDETTLIRIKLLPGTFENIHSFIETIRPDFLIFLKYIDRVEINVDGQRKVFERHPSGPIRRLNDIDIESVLMLVNNKPERLLIFRREVKVPENVKKDRRTVEAKRGMVDKRDIYLALSPR